MKVLVFLKNVDSGTGTFALSLQKLNSKSLQINILSLQKPKYRIKIKKNISYFLPRQYPEYYILSLKHFLNFFQELIWLRKKISEYSPNAIISVDFHSNILAILITKIFFRNTRLIISTHNNIYMALQKKSHWIIFVIIKKTITLFYNTVSEHITISKELAKNIQKNFKLKNCIKVIYYGVPLKKRSLPKSDIFFNTTIISSGRLVQQKDFYTLIDATATIKDKNLVILGDGPEKQKLLSYAEKVSIKNNIFFLGWNNLANILNKYTNPIFVLSSHWEGLSYVLLEAMAQGIPIIASDCDFGPRELLENGKFGILFDPGNSVQLAKAIKYLSNKKSYKKYAEKSLKRSLFFSESDMLQRYKELLLHKHI